MSRYFLDVSYMGTGYAGFQIQQNAITIQSEVEQALRTYLKIDIVLTGSSRTDTGVHALQNFFHFDFEGEVLAGSVYNLNALLPGRIAVRGIYKMRDGSHCRFDAVWRQYRYMVYRKKDPFITDRAYYFPYVVDIALMQEAAAVVLEYTDFRSFAKRNSQVKTFECRIMESGWEEKDGYFQYRVRANRFLRGMVRGLVGTMLQVGRAKIGL
ncbi:MAG: tRNA pseudouridine(38-40) synthase TruA, partial [Flavitalea sp.]